MVNPLCEALAESGPGIRAYRELRELLRAFADRLIVLLVIVTRTSLGKPQKDPRVLSTQAGGPFHESSRPHPGFQPIYGRRGRNLY